MKRFWIYAALNLAAIALRFVWTSTDPLHFDTVKTFIYVRDAACLAPAALFGALAVAALPEHGVRLSRRTIVAGGAVLATTLSALLAALVLRGMPAVVDEAAYLWQAQLFADGHLTGATPDPAAATLVQYVGDIDGRRVSVFFPGSALPLALGVLAGVPWLVNPLLAGLLVLASAWSARRLFDGRTAALSAALLSFSPFLLFQGASYFGQIWTALLTLPAVTLAIAPKRRFEPALVGFLLAAALFSRPVSAVVAGIVVLTVWAVRDRSSLVRNVAFGSAAALPVTALFLWMNKHLTGSWLTTAHNFLLPHDQPVFGLNVIRNLVLNAGGMAVDLTGLVVVGAVLVVVAAWRLRSSFAVRAIAGYAALQAVSYAFYYNHGISYGPRFLLEIAPFLAMLAAVGVSMLFARRGAYVIALAAVIAVAGVAPERAQMFGQRAEYLRLDGVESQVDAAAGGRGAIVIVGSGEYQFPDPFNEAFVRNGPQPLSNRVTFVRSDAIEGCDAVRRWPDRAVFAYDPVDRSRPGGGDAPEAAIRPVAGCSPG